MYVYIDADSYDSPTKPGLFGKAGKAFGDFQKKLADYPADTLCETIPNFHNTPSRYRDFLNAVEHCALPERLNEAEKEISFLLERRNLASLATDRLKTGEIPLRVTHNDTKLNNILMDKRTGEGLCVIDLDTVMPGSLLYDFGDAIRFGANTAAEDEPDVSKVHFDLYLFELYTRGYLEAAGAALTDTEKEYLPWGAKLMTLECGIRFLTDYLQGDTYFKVSRARQNLERCRTQFKLVADMENVWDEMASIVKKYS